MMPVESGSNRDKGLLRVALKFVVSEKISLSMGVALGILFLDTDADILKYLMDKGPVREFVRVTILILASVAASGTYIWNIVNQHGLRSDLLAERAESARLLGENERLVENERFLNDSIREMIRTQLKRVVSDSLVIADATEPNVRLTVYVPTTDNQFQLLERYSPSPRFDGYRMFHKPADRGILGLVWKDGAFFIDRLPCPNSEKRPYAQFHRGTGLMSDEIERLQMRSRLYYGCLLTDSEKEPLGVLLFESENPNHFDKDFLDSVFLDEQATEIARMLKPLQGKFAYMNIPQKRGY